MIRWWILDFSLCSTFVFSTCPNCASNIQIHPKESYILPFPSIQFTKRVSRFFLSNLSVNLHSINFNKNEIYLQRTTQKVLARSQFRAPRLREFVKSWLLWGIWQIPVSVWNVIIWMEIRLLDYCERLWGIVGNTIQWCFSFGSFEFSIERGKLFFFLSIRIEASQQFVQFCRGEMNANCQPSSVCLINYCVI